MGLISNLIPDWLANVLAALAAYLFRLFGSRSGLTAECRVRGALIGPRHGARGLYLGRNVILSDPKGVRLGAGVTVNGGTQLIAGTKGYIRIGDKSHVSRNSVLAGAGGIEIGRHCMISSGVIIYSVTYDRSSGQPVQNCPAKLAKVTIQDEVHIGAGVIILPGVTVARGAVLGAGAVVTRDVAAGAVIAGVPARKIREI